MKNGVRSSIVAPIVALVVGGFALGAIAQDAERVTKEEIAAKLNGVEASDITDSPLPGVYQVQVGSRIAYISVDGRFFLQGDLYDLTTSTNLTESSRALARVELLSGVQPQDMMVFAPKGRATEHTITIFTDIDCGYCRQFHREIEQVNALGIEVHYLFYPRTGPDTESWAKAEKVWCSGAAERNNALTRAKLGGEVPETACADNPVDAHWQLGRDVGVTGTPSVIAENGEVIGGYLAPQVLLKTLQDLSAN